MKEIDTLVTSSTKYVRRYKRMRMYDKLLSMERSR